ncbi:uncharacterized protein TRUGW13939_06947 [Talaromyces rugulosus]|uniref:Peptidase S9 prolyl oligopeptidase catalytic domain-containing protein n=1 Tax=Talaromyces rugulosus TaxID=121627 RepID=A0A7H8R254_TALRU|nr:uncharacterized protein TRUGW13939_06947 [Talaromyces rugulosus]QKX59805.1 hypothetical protein TRUGW13939_06947 [Talaromyces rugulosus]
MGDMAITEDMLKNIIAPVFVASAEDDSVAPGQTEEIARLLGDQATYHLFQTKLGAGEHCRLGAEPRLAMITMEWLQGVFEKAKA